MLPELLLASHDDVVVFFLDADDALRRAHHLHGLQHAAQERFGEVVQQLLVLVQQGLALGGVGNHQRHARPQLDRRRKPSPAGTDDAVFPYASRWLWLRTTFGRTNLRLPCFWCHER